jgi:hypothetical protein
VFAWGARSLMAAAAAGVAIVLALLPWSRSHPC